MTSKDPAHRILDLIEPLIREIDVHAIALTGLDTYSDCSREDAAAYKRIQEVLAQVTHMLDGYRSALGESPIHPTEEDLKLV